MSRLACMLLVGFCCAACAASTRAPSQPNRSPARVDRSALFDLGRDHARAGDHLRAEQYLLAALQQGYPEHQVLPLLVQACVSSDRLRSALSHAEPYLRSHPDELALRQLVASIHLALGEPERAQRELSALAELSPQYAPAQYLLGVIADEAFLDSASARRYFETYLRLAPRGAHAARVANWLREHPSPVHPRAKGNRS